MTSIGPIGPGGPDPSRPIEGPGSLPGAGPIKSNKEFEAALSGARPPDVPAARYATLQLVDQLLAQGLTPEAALEAAVRQEVQRWAGSAVSPEIVDRIVEQVRNDPAMAPITRRLFAAPGS